MKCTANVTPKMATQTDRSLRVSPLLWLYRPIGVAILLLALAQLAPNFYRDWMVSERSVMEAVHVLVPAAAFFIAVDCLRLPALKPLPWLKVWLGIAAVGSFYIVGEEMSWGQHLLNWATPEYWSTLNDQDETNLHNITSWFDQKPRAVLQTGVVIGGILLPIYTKFRPALLGYRWSIILPPAICLPTAVLSELVDRSKDAIAVFELPWYLFYRASEVHETFLYWFILLYLIVLRRRLKGL